MSICLKLIFWRLFMKLATVYTFKFNNRFLKHVDGCTIGEALSVSFSDIYMAKIENHVVILSKPKYYQNLLMKICR